MIDSLNRYCSQIRRDIIRMVHAPQSGHPGGSLGCVEFFVALYQGGVMNYNPSKFCMEANNEDVFIHTIKPLDEIGILQSVYKTRAVVTCEEHNYIGGLGESIAGLLGRKLPVPVEMVAVNDTFGESGDSSELLTKYGLDPVNIVEACKRVIARKN
jgi:deoxyxylulose-5-phosphate synthase